MPMYEFICPMCGEKHERLITAESKDIPQRCLKGHIMNKVPSTPAFSVKGYNAKNGYSNANV